LTNISSELCEDCNRRIDTNPIRVLDCKNTHCQILLINSPKLIANLCDECDSDFKKLKSLLEGSNIAYEIDTNLVRGLDYYNKTAFEFISNEIGSQSAIAGGGRYDKLVEYLDGRATPAIGFALGIERILDLVVLPEKQRDGLYLCSMEEAGVDILCKLASKLRATDKVTVDYNTKGLKSHLKSADKALAKEIYFIGGDELANGTIWIKDLENKEERVMSIDSL